MVVVVVVVVVIVVVVTEGLETKLDPFREIKALGRLDRSGLVGKMFMLILLLLLLKLLVRGDVLEIEVFEFIGEVEMVDRPEFTDEYVGELFEFVSIC